MKRQYLKQFIGFIGVCLMIIGSAFENLYAQEMKSTFNETELIKFIEDYMTDEMATHHIAGAAVVAIKDDKEILKRGYGYSDVEQKILVNPDTTTFPIASVSKLFTATAIMQLYEHGKIDLNKDIHAFIEDIKIDNPYDQKVTCSNLLTHSSGMDEGNELLGSTLDAAAIKSQETYFKNHKLKVVERPNLVSRYSNLGYNLLGLIVARQSGQTYEDYIQSHLLTPLEMTHSTIRTHDQHMAKGYVYENGQYKSLPYAYQYTSGSAGVISTVKDMENFMKVFLNKGYFNGKQFLKEESINKMQQKMFSNDGCLAGMAYGFIRQVRNGQLILKHEGALPGYMSVLLLIPEEQLGIYLSVNTFDAMPFRFEEAFMDRFCGKEEIGGLAKDADSKKVYNMKQYVGTYRNYDGIAQSNLMKMAILFDEATDTRLKLNNEGQLILEEYDQQKKKCMTQLIPIAKDRFIRMDGKGYYAFKQSKDACYAFNEISHNAYKRIQPYETKQVLWGIIFITTLVDMIDFIRNVGVILKRKRTYVLSRINLVALVMRFIGMWGSVTLMIYMVSTYNYYLIGALYGVLTLLLLSSIWYIGRLIGYGVNWYQHNISFKTLLYEIVMISVGLVYCSLLNSLHLLGYYI